MALKSFSDKVGETRRAQTEAVDALVQQAVKLPEYKDYEKAVTDAERRGNQQMSPLHPASEVNLYDQHLMLERLNKAASAAEGKLRDRLGQDGVAAEQLGDVMTKVRAAAQAGAKATLGERGY